MPYRWMMSCSFKTQARRVNHQLEPVWPDGFQSHLTRALVLILPPPGLKKSISFSHALLLTRRPPSKKGWFKDPYIYAQTRPDTASHSTSWFHRGRSCSLSGQFLGTAAHDCATLGRNRWTQPSKDLFFKTSRGQLTSYYKSFDWRVDRELLCTWPVISERQVISTCGLICSTCTCL